MSAVSYSRVGSESESAQSRGVIYIHACPNAVAPHLEWALAKVLGTEVPMDWAPQPVAPGQLRSQIIWSGKQGMGARIASALLAFHHARYEVTEDPSSGHEGERFAATPDLGLFRATIGTHGDVMVHEERLRTALAFIITRANTNGVYATPIIFSLRMNLWISINFTGRSLHNFCILSLG